jgi:hypothetical protein
MQGPTTLHTYINTILLLKSMEIFSYVVAFKIEGGVQVCGW